VYKMYANLIVFKVYDICQTLLWPPIK